MNAHHHEISFIVDVQSPKALVIEKTFEPPASLRFRLKTWCRAGTAALLNILKTENLSGLCLLRFLG